MSDAFGQLLVMAAGLCVAYMIYDLTMCVGMLVAGQP